MKTTTAPMAIPAIAPPESPDDVSSEGGKVGEMMGLVLEVGLVVGWDSDKVDVAGEVTVE